ncbi:hypothetical protein [Streptomyces sp. NPDC058424]
MSGYRGAKVPVPAVWEAVSAGLDHIHVGSIDMPSRAYVAASGFKGAGE